MEVEPYVTDTMWNPELNTKKSQVAHAIVLLHDVKVGEKLTLNGDDC